MGIGRQAWSWVVMFIDREINRNNIVMYADMAMNQAKQDGRNIIRFCDSNAQTKRGSSFEN